MTLRKMLLSVWIYLLCDGGLAVGDGVLVGPLGLELRKGCHRHGF
jgi:hypothetical protein